MAILKTFFALPASDKRLVLLTAPIVVGVRLALTILPSAFIVRTLGHPSLTQVSEVKSQTSTPSSITRIVEAVSFRVPGASCLTQALSARLLLARHGYDSLLCLGVARGAAGLRAHAWLEHNGEVVIGGSVDEFTRLPQLGGNQSPLPGR